MTIIQEERVGWWGLHLSHHNIECFFHLVMLYVEESMSCQWTFVWACSHFNMVLALQMWSSKQKWKGFRTCQVLGDVLLGMKQEVGLKSESASIKYTHGHIRRKYKIKSITSYLISNLKPFWDNREETLMEKAWFFFSGSPWLLSSKAYIERKEEKTLWGCLDSRNWSGSEEVGSVFSHFRCSSKYRKRKMEKVLFLLSFLLYTTFSSLPECYS